jgi:hypothetical protein
VLGSNRNIVYKHTGNISLVKMRLLTTSAVSIFIEMLKNKSWDNIINRTEVNKSFN